MPINSINDLANLMTLKQQETNKVIITMAKEIAQKEWSMFEFNLFISAFGKEKLDKCTKKIQELRKKVDKRIIDLSKYEAMAEEF